MKNKILSIHIRMLEQVMKKLQWTQESSCRHWKQNSGVEAAHWQGLGLGWSPLSRWAGTGTLRPTGQEMDWAPPSLGAGESWTCSCLPRQPQPPSHFCSTCPCFRWWSSVARICRTWRRCGRRRISWLGCRCCSWCSLLGSQEAHSLGQQGRQRLHDIKFMWARIWKINSSIMLYYKYYMTYYFYY